MAVEEAMPVRWGRAMRSGRIGVGRFTTWPDPATALAT
ncbi:Hypothetical protein EPM1_3233 [Stenotrophomonas maltophilia EPM1]|nr:Hypothetical protein EPM1_3233 [Stenotrophomonas maltophilia EPM1]